MSRFTDAAYGCLVKRVTDTIEGGDADTMLALSETLEQQYSYAQEHGWYNSAKRIEGQLHKLALALQQMES